MYSVSPPSLPPASQGPLPPPTSPTVLANSVHKANLQIFYLWSFIYGKLLLGTNCYVAFYEAGSINSFTQHTLWEAHVTPGSSIFLLLDVGDSLKCKIWFQKMKGKDLSKTISLNFNVGKSNLSAGTQSSGHRQCVDVFLVFFLLDWEFLEEEDHLSQMFWCFPPLPESWKNGPLWNVKFPNFVSVFTTKLA